MNSELRFDAIAVLKLCNYTFKGWKKKSLLMSITGLNLFFNLLTFNLLKFSLSHQSDNWTAQ